MGEFKMTASKRDIKHITEINAPVDIVWDKLIDINNWDWNEWTRLETDKEPAQGVKGKLKASYEGDDKWETFDFTFGEVNGKTHVLTWFGRVGPNGCLFSGYHTMRLESITSKTTRLIHTEKFGGLLPSLGLGLPYDKLERNYLYMNESLKSCIEAKSTNIDG